MKQLIALNVNGQTYQIAVDAHQTLLDVLRNNLGLTGTKEGCDHGECGACTVIMDGQAVLSCLLLAVDSQDKEVLTIEGLAQDGQLHPIQKAFVEKSAIQCGYCTPGMILAAKALLDDNPKPSEEEVRDAIGGNLCRCTGYVKIVEAIQSSAT